MLAVNFCRLPAGFLTAELDSIDIIFSKVLSDWKVIPETFIDS